MDPRIAQVFANIQLQPFTQAIFDFLFHKFPYVGVLFCLQILDIISGGMAAYINRNVKGKALSSSVTYSGMMRKALVWIMVGAGGVVRLVVPQLPEAGIIAMLFIIHEMLSITENAARAGLPLPKNWLDALEKVKELTEAKNLMANPPPPVVPQQVPFYVEKKETVYMDGKMPDIDHPLPVAVVEVKPSAAMGVVSAVSHDAQETRDTNARSEESPKRA